MGVFAFMYSHLYTIKEKKKKSHFICHPPPLFLCSSTESLRVIKLIPRFYQLLIELHNGPLRQG